MRLTARQLKSMIREAIYLNEYEGSRDKEAKALADEAYKTLNALYNVVNIIAINRGGDDQPDTQEWEKAAKQIKSMASQLDSIGVLSEFEYTEPEVYSDNPNHGWRKKSRSR